MTSPAFGGNVGIETPEDQVDLLRPLLPHWWVEQPVEPDRLWFVPSASIAGFVVGELELWVAEHAIDLTFLHAAVVTIGGRALLLPGRSLCGKSTLTAALLRAGATYGSDEYAVLDADGAVHPYARPITLRGDDGVERVAAGDLGAPTMDGPARVAAVAVLQYRSGARFDVSTVSPAAGTLRLIDNAVAARSRPEQVLDAIAAATGSAQWVTGTRGEGDAAAAMLLELMSAE